MKRRAFVLGGGVAGICAAFELLDRGLAVELIESHSWLGGRVSSFPHEPFETRLDNGPHVLLGCYEEFRGLLRRLGTEDRFAVERGLTIQFQRPTGSTKLQLGPLPVPIAFPLAVGRMPWPWRDRQACLRGMVATLRRTSQSWNLEQWIEAHGQLGTPRQHLWDPLCRAIMNAEPADVCANAFLATLRRAFSGSASAAAIWIATAPWSEIVDQPARRLLTAAGCRVHTGRRIQELSVVQGVIREIRCADQAISISGKDLVVSALPWHCLPQVLGEAMPVAPELRSAPIVSIYCLGIADSVATGGSGLHVLIDSAPFHFVYRNGQWPSGMLALLSGGSRAFDGQSVDQVIATARATLERYFGAHAIGEPSAWRVHKEARATFVASPQVDALRVAPGRADGIANLRLCGDWTQTGLPATLEGAALSAKLALMGM